MLTSAMANAGVTSNNIGSMAFRDVVPFFRSEPVLDAIRDVLRNVLNEVGEPTFDANPRVVAASYMIALHRDQCFEPVNAIEAIHLQDAVFEAAKDLVDRFDSSTSAEEVFTALTEYFKCFNEWKVPDTQRLVVRIENALLVINQALEQIDLNNDTNVRLALTTQIERLRTKLGQLDPAALQRYDQRANNSE